MKNGTRYFRPDSRGKQYPLVETAKHYCLTPFCRHTVHRKNEHSPYCTRCRSRNFRKNHPAKAHYLDLKNRAGQRGHEFTITFEEYYQEVWLDTGYAEKHGKTAECLSVDRVENDKGYVSGNLSVKTVSENSRKRDRNQFVPFFAHQQENIAYKPSDEELMAVASQL